MDTITEEDKDKLIKEVMENYPEYSAGSTLQCKGWDYEKCNYLFIDEEDKEMLTTLETLKVGFDKLYADVRARKIHIFGSTEEITDGGNWDATAVDALVQYALFGEVIYG